MEGQLQAPTGIVVGIVETTQAEGGGHGDPCRRVLEYVAALREAMMTLTIEIEREEDGRWIAEVPGLSGVLCYGGTRDQAIARVQALALRVIAERLEHGEAPPELLTVSFEAA
jgi:predicted RNase H-like HicB family nuclease